MLDAKVLTQQPSPDLVSLMNRHHARAISLETARALPAGTLIRWRPEGHEVCLVDLDDFVGQA